MTTSEKNILDAALQLFARYGVKRTTMADLAEAAGVSRQTLYNSFRNKDEVLRALIRAFADEALADIEKGLEGVDDLDRQLEIVFDRMVVAGYDMVQRTPNAHDLVDGFNAVGRAEMSAAAERFRALIERLFRPHADTLRRAGLAAPGLADFVQRAAKAASGTARDRGHLLDQLETLKRLCLVAAGQPKRA